jgi:hypothetical protein
MEQSAEIGSTGVIVTDDDNFPTDRYVLEGMSAPTRAPAHCRQRAIRGMLIQSQFMSASFSKVPALLAGYVPRFASELLH